jgi:hypothetical protein
MAEIEAKLQKLGLVLPEPLKIPPALALVIVRGKRQARLHLRSLAAES